MSRSGKFLNFLFNSRRSFSPSNNSNKHVIQWFSNASKRSNIKYLLFYGGSFAFANFLFWKNSRVYALNPRKIKDDHEKAVRLTARERRFIKFASVEFDGQLYMTPQDFLDSVVEQEPRPRLKRKMLSLQDVAQIKDTTPTLNKGSPSLFRSLRDKGIVSYTDYAWREKRGITDEKEEDLYIDHEEGLQRRHKVDTTLQVHFFGKKGNQDLRYEGFYKFMDDLQTEVLELEFSEFSKGNLQITEVDFAKILLRYTYLDTDEYDMYLDRLLDRVKDEKGVSFKEFRDFCQFLNNLDDFSIAMRMYTLADQAISKEEFSRAVQICTGFQLTPHLIETVFAIFDEDGDGLLSYKEFIAIMKDRLHRGFKSAAAKDGSGWDAFKQCVRHELKSNRI